MKTTLHQFLFKKRNREESAIHSCSILDHDLFAELKPLLLIYLFAVFFFCFLFA